MAVLNATMDVSNVSSGGQSSCGSSCVIPAVVLFLCFLLGLPGNIAVIVLKPNLQHMSGLSLSLMLNLAVSDLFCLLTVPLWIYTLLYGWTLGLHACKFFTYFMCCSMNCSLLTVMTLSVQRYLQVVHKKKWMKTNGQRGLLVLLWLAVMVLSVPALVTRKTVNDENMIKCKATHSSWSQHVVVLLIESVLKCSAVSVVAFAYIHIHRRVKKATFFNNSKTSRLIRSITVTFLILWIPYLVWNILSLVGLFIQKNSVLEFLMDNFNSIGALTFLNSCLNPFMYALASKNVCRGCLKNKHQNSRSSNISTALKDEKCEEPLTSYGE